MGLLQRINPSRALARERDRLQLEMLQGLRDAQTSANSGSETRYRGASRMLRSMMSWLPGLGSPRQDTPTGERETLIARSRDAYRNHMIGRAAISRASTNIVGMGLTVRPNVDAKALGIDDDQANALNDQLSRGFRLWAEDPAECDAEAALDFYMLQGLGFVSALVSGDVFGFTPFEKRPGGLFGLKIQLVEAERVGEPMGFRSTPNEFDGVRRDDLGRVTHLHVCSGYPSDHLGRHTWEWVPVFGENTGRRRVIHLMNEKDRPGQPRGVPYLAPILEALQKLERFTQAELTAAVISAMFTVALKRTKSDEDPGLGGATLWDDQSTDPNKRQVVSSDRDQSPAGDALTLGEGAVWELEDGVETETINPARPNAQFDPFFVAVVKEIGAALEQPAEVLLMHFSTSYTAARAAFNQLLKFIQKRRHHLQVQFCQPVYELVIDEMVASGMIRLPGYSDPARRRAYTRSLWIGEPLGSLNELVDARAATERIANGTSNEHIETMSLHGEEWGDVAQDRARELRWKRDNGVPVYIGGKVEEGPAASDQDTD